MDSHRVHCQRSGINKGALATILVTLPLTLFSSYTLGQRQKEQQAAVKEIRQGGYVEKVEPGVDYAARLPHTEPLSPDQSLEQFHLVPGYTAELAAAEPLIRDPVDIAWDEDGRMIVAELITYSEAADTLQGRVSILEDLDHDGRFETGHVFVDQLAWPTGILWFDRGLFVATPPDLLYCKDTDGDGKADVREKVITGFTLTNPNQCVNSLRWNFDCRVELMPAGGGGLLQPLRWQQTEKGQDSQPIQIRGRDLSFEPRSGEMRPESGGSQYGMTFDSFGRKFESANSDPIEMVMYEDRYIARNPFLAAPKSRIPIWVDGNSVYRTSPVEPWRIIRTEMRVRGVFSGPVEGGGRPDGYFTSACGVMIYDGDGWEDAAKGQAFVCEGAGNLVHRMELRPNGVAFTAHRLEQKKEFLTSDEIWFKPVQLHNGPDGMLYVADMYREIYEHPDAVPPSVRKHVDLNTGNDRGRIYRIVPVTAKPTRPQPPMSRMPTKQLVGLLAHRNAWIRRTASRLIYERQDQQVAEQLSRMVSEGPTAESRVHAMYAMDSIGRLTEEAVLTGLEDAAPPVREHAVRISERLLDSSPRVRAQLYSMSDDDDIRVRYQLAFTLGFIAGEQATNALAEIAHRDVGERWIQLAVLSSSLGRAGDLYARMVATAPAPTGQAGLTLLDKLAEQAGLQNRSDQALIIIRQLETQEAEHKPLTQATLRGLTRGLSKSQSPLLTKLNNSEGSPLATVLHEMITTAKQTALQDDASVAARVSALQTLANSSYAEAEEVIVELLDSRQPQAIQTAAIRTLSRFHEESVAELIVEAWYGFSPSVRRVAAEALFARTERLRQLFTALEDGTITTSQLDPARLTFLRTHPDSTIRQRAITLLEGDTLARRADVVKTYTTGTQLSGDTQRGKAIFKRECSQCHKLEGIGFDLGLPLQNVKSRGAEGILVQILDPNREVNPAYLNYTVLTNRGRLMTGMITAETATSVTLSRAEGEEDTILRTDIDELESTNLSIMPEGLEQKVNRQEMADLIHYLLQVVDQ